MVCISVPGTIASSALIERCLVESFDEWVDWFVYGAVGIWRKEVMEGMGGTAGVHFLKRSSL